MNHHADKVVDPLTEDELALVDPALGGVIKEAHHCAVCGHAAFRPAPPTHSA
jgi:hypothetical protein